MDGTVAAAKRFATLGENDAGPTEVVMALRTVPWTAALRAARRACRPRALSKRLATLGVSDGGWGESFVQAVTAALPA